MLRVLIIKPSSLGDIIHGLQVAQSLRAQAGAVEIDWVASKTFAPLVRACPVVDRVYEFDRHGSTASFARLIKEIRKERYDWALDMQGLIRSAMMLAATRAKNKVGRADCREGAGFFYRKKPALPPNGRFSHALDILLQFLPVMGLKAELTGEPLEFLHPAHSLLSPEVVRRGPIILFPDSRVKKKEWSGFYDLTVRLLKEKHGHPIIWAGSRGPEPELNWPEDKFINLLGRSSLEQLPELIGSARLVICNDSGPMHIAAALHRPVIALFGPTDHERFGPYPLNNPRNHVIRAAEGKLANLSLDVVMMNLQQALKNH